MRGYLDMIEYTGNLHVHSTYSDGAGSIGGSQPDDAVEVRRDSISVTEYT